MIPTDQQYWLDLIRQGLDRPDVVDQLLASYNRPSSPDAQPGGQGIVSGLYTKSPESPTPALRQPSFTMPRGQTMEQYAQSSTAPQGNMLTNARVAAATPQQPAQTQPNGYEEYMKYFSKTLPAEPKLDTKRRNQLAAVAAINALGQMVKQVVDLHGRSKYGAPITAQQPSTATPILLSQYEKERDDYLNRKDKYDYMKMNTMQDAFKYAYGDERDRENYQQQWALLQEQHRLAGQREDKEIAARKELYGDQAEAQAKRDVQQHENDLAKLRKNWEYEKDLIEQRNNDALNILKEKAGVQAAVKTAAQLAKKSLLVTDTDPNNPITIPPQIYMDVLQKQIALQNQDFTTFLTSVDFNATQNAGDIMVARYWKDFYKPIYDKNGNVESWESLGAKYETSTTGAATTGAAKTGVPILDEIDDQD